MKHKKRRWLTALALIAAEVVIDRAVLPKVQRRVPLKAAAGANRSH